MNPIVNTGGNRGYWKQRPELVSLRTAFPLWFEAASNLDPGGISWRWEKQKADGISGPMKVPTAAVKHCAWCGATPTMDDDSRRPPAGKVPFDKYGRSFCRKHGHLAVGRPRPAREPVAPRFKHNGWDSAWCGAGVDRIPLSPWPTPALFSRAPWVGTSLSRPVRGSRDVPEWSPPRVPAPEPRPRAKALSIFASGKNHPRLELNGERGWHWEDPSPEGGTWCGFRRKLKSPLQIESIDGVLTEIPRPLCKKKRDPRAAGKIRRKAHAGLRGWLWAVRAGNKSNPLGIVGIAGNWRFGGAVDLPPRPSGSYSIDGSVYFFDENPLQEWETFPGAPRRAKNRGKNRQDPRERERTATMRSGHKMVSPPTPGPGSFHWKLQQPIPPELRAAAWGEHFGKPGASLAAYEDAAGFSFPDAWIKPLLLAMRRSVSCRRELLFNVSRPGAFDVEGVASWPEEYARIMGWPLSATAVLKNAEYIRSKRFGPMAPFPEYAGELAVIDLLLRHYGFGGGGGRGGVLSEKSIADKLLNPAKLADWVEAFAAKDWDKVAGSNRGVSTETIEQIQQGARLLADWIRNAAQSKSILPWREWVKSWEPIYYREDTELVDHLRETLESSDRKPVDRWGARLTLWKFGGPRLWRPTPAAHLDCGCTYGGTDWEPSLRVFGPLGAEVEAESQCRRGETYSRPDAGLSGETLRDGAWIKVTCPPTLANERQVRVGQFDHAMLVEIPAGHAVFRGSPRDTWEDDGRVNADKWFLLGDQLRSYRAFGYALQQKVRAAFGGGYSVAPEKSETPLSPADQDFEHAAEADLNDREPGSASDNDTPERYAPHRTYELICQLEPETVKRRVAIHRASSDPEYVRRFGLPALPQPKIEVSIRNRDGRKSPGKRDQWHAEPGGIPISAFYAWGLVDRSTTAASVDRAWRGVSDSEDSRAWVPGSETNPARPVPSFHRKPVVECSVTLCSALPPVTPKNTTPWCATTHSKRDPGAPEYSKLSSDWFPKPAEWTLPTYAPEVPKVIFRESKNQGAKSHDKPQRHPSKKHADARGRGRKTSRPA